jgi:hypothetical protein
MDRGDATCIYACRGLTIFPRPPPLGCGGQGARHSPDAHALQALPHRAEDIGVLQAESPAKPDQVGGGRAQLLPHLRDIDRFHRVWSADDHDTPAGERSDEALETEFGVGALDDSRRQAQVVRQLSHRRRGGFGRQRSGSDAPGRFSQVTSQADRPVGVSTNLHSPRAIPADPRDCRRDRRTTRT